MNQKGISSIVIILVIVGVLAAAGGVYYFAVQKPSQPEQPVLPTQPEEQPSLPDETTQLSDNTFSINLNGYYKTCLDTLIIYKRTNGSWEKVLTRLPYEELHYLDNKLVGPTMCDVVKCSGLPKPYTIQLVEYKKVGEKVPPNKNITTANTLPVYQTIPLSGDVKIEIQYFSDKNCQNKKTFSKVLRLPLKKNL